MSNNVDVDTGPDMHPNSPGHSDLSGVRLRIWVRRVAFRENAKQDRHGCSEADEHEASEPKGIFES